MGLVQLPVCDETEVVGEEDFAGRNTLYGKLKDSPLTDNKAFVGNKTAFETTEYTGDRQCVPCYLGTVSKYLKFFSFSLRRKGGEGVETRWKH